MKERLIIQTFLQQNISMREMKKYLRMGHQKIQQIMKSKELDSYKQKKVELKNFEKN